MRTNKTAIIIGATGLIGSHLLTLLQEDTSFSKITILVRHPLALEHPKVKEIILDFNKQEDFRAAITKCDVVYCMVGTTTKKVKGNKEAYRKVDVDIPVNAAKYSREVGCTQLALVSAIGANSSSSNFYQKIKGEVEDIISGLELPTLLIFRPSLLLGKRQELRFGEKIAVFIMPLIAFLLPSKLRPIKASQVAKAMLEASKKEVKGKLLLEYKEMMQIHQSTI